MIAFYILVIILAITILLFSKCCCKSCRREIENNPVDEATKKHSQDEEGLGKDMIEFQEFNKSQSSKWTKRTGGRGKKTGSKFVKTIVLDSGSGSEDKTLNHSQSLMNGSKAQLVITEDHLEDGKMIGKT